MLCRLAPQKAGRGYPVPRARPRPPVTIKQPAAGGGGRGHGPRGALGVRQRLLVRDQSPGEWTQLPVALPLSGAAGVPGL